MKIDLHVHTCRSRDSSIPFARAVAKHAKDRGLTGIAVTDHDEFKGVHEMKVALEGTGILIIPGEEVRAESGGEVLCYFPTDKIQPRSLEEILDDARDHDAVTVLAHPFDGFRGNWKTLLLDSQAFNAVSSKIDGLETFNARNFWPGANEAARVFAADHDMVQVAGSDAHLLFEIGTAWTEVDTSSTSVDDLRAAFGKKRLSSVRHEHGKDQAGPLDVMLRAGSALRRKFSSGLNSALPSLKAWRVSRHSDQGR